MKVRCVTNSNTSTTAKQAEEDIRCPNGCESRRGLRQEDNPRSSWLTMSPGYGRYPVKDVRLLLVLRLPHANRTNAQAFGRVHQQSHVSMDE